MYECDSWTIKKAKCWRIDAFELWCWRRLLRVSWTARRSNQSILVEISSERSLEGLMLKLKIQYFGHLKQKTESFEKTLILGKIEGRRRRGQQKMRWLDGITWLDGPKFDQAPGSGNGQGSLVWCSQWGRKRVRYDWATELIQNLKSLFFHLYDLYLFLSRNTIDLQCHINLRCTTKWLSIYLSSFYSSSDPFPFGKE